jgi:hypothetical protein
MAIDRQKTIVTHNEIVESEGVAPERSASRALRTSPRGSNGRRVVDQSSIVFLLRAVSNAG